MVNKKVIFVLVIAFLFAWAPWISKEGAKQRISTSMVKSCGLSCSYCGVGEPKKVPFGYEAEVEASCGAMAKKNVYVSLLGTLHDW